MSVQYQEAGNKRNGKDGNILPFVSLSCGLKFELELMVEAAFKVMFEMQCLVTAQDRTIPTDERTGRKEWK